MLVLFLFSIIICSNFDPLSIAFREKSVLSICQLNENEHIVGFLALQDFPLIPSIDKAAWEEYIWAKYK